MEYTIDDVRTGILAAYERAKEKASDVFNDMRENPQSYVYAALPAITKFYGKPVDADDMFRYGMLGLILGLPVITLAVGYAMISESSEKK